MPKYKYVGKVDFIEPSLKNWIIKPNEIIETTSEIPKYLLDSGLFEVVDENEPKQKNDVIIEFKLQSNEEKEIDIDNSFYNFLQIQVIPPDNYNSNKNLIVDVYQNHNNNEQGHLIVDLYTIIQVSNINTLNKNVHKLYLKARETNISDCIVRIHLSREYKKVF